MGRLRLWLRVVVGELATLEEAARDQAMAQQTFEELRQMRATWWVFLRMEQLQLENNTQVISVPKNDEPNINVLACRGTEAEVQEAACRRPLTDAPGVGQIYIIHCRHKRTRHF